MKRGLLHCLDNLAAARPSEPGFTAAQVRKVPIKMLRAEMVNLGHLDVDDDRRITSASKALLSRVKSELLGANVIVEADQQVWRVPR